MTTSKALILASVVIFILGIFINFNLGQMGMLLLGSALFASGHL